MPLWKKAKYNRISQLVADHLHQPKRGGSLVVETGFPTSLVDLFDKNRDRLMKPHKKTRFDYPVPPPPSSSQPVAPPNSSTVASSRPLNCRIAPPSARDSASGHATPHRCSSGRFGNEIVAIQREDGGRDEVVNANGVCIAILKMFLVVVLTLWTKKFVVGITISAFLLLVIDFAGKHLFKLPKPCAKAQKSLQSLVERVLGSLGIKRDRFMIREDRVLTAPDVKGRTFSGLIDESNLVKDGIQNVQIEQHGANLVPPPGELPSVDCEIALPNGEEKLLCEDTGKMEAVMEKEKAHTSDVLDLKGKKTHRRRIKSKIKKLVQKKLCGSKKKQLELNTQASSSSVENKVAMDGERDGLECDERSLLLPSRWGGDQVEGVNAIQSCGELSGPDMDDSKVGEEVGTETKGNPGYPILILIVLVGLVGGRVLALSLALSWCLLVKLAATLKRCMKRSSDDVSISS